MLTSGFDLDVDHVVPLAEAWRSGLYLWETDRRAAFADDLSYADRLIAVTASANRSKSDSPPNDWRAPRREIWCRYATAWVTVKVTWSLTATDAPGLEAGRLSLPPRSPLLRLAQDQVQPAAHPPRAAAASAMTKPQQVSSSTPSCSQASRRAARPSRASGAAWPRRAR